MFRKMTLRVRIIILLAALVMVAFSSGGVMVWYTLRVRDVFSEIIDRNLAAFDTAASLENALVNQKGFVTYYFIDGDPKWLDRLQEYREIFQDRLKKAKVLSQDAGQHEAIDRIDREYNRYIQLKDRVIEFYKRGEKEQGSALHKTVRQLFFDIIGHCEAFKRDQFNQILEVRIYAESASSRLRMATAAIIGVQTVLAIVLGVFLIHQILTPVHQMLKTTTRNPRKTRSENVVLELSRTVSDLLENMGQAELALAKSRENLLQAEKMALVGKLAAGMAHSIRNPFTSVKMRLFSLGRSLELDATQQEDLEVISQEIRHIDHIVQNFLEFSRPPKLVLQPISPSVIVDHALRMLAHRLDAYGVTVDVVRTEPLPEVMADPEQLKEVLVNLIVNACEEMKNGGSILVTEQIAGQGADEHAVLYVSDSGLGVPPSHVDKIFQPFFTSKEEGTGLGLSIASRIVQEHGGTLTLDNDFAAGATFVVRLPVKDIRV